MKILVTGAAGQLGTDLVRLGGDDGHEMIGLDQRPLEIASADAINTAAGATPPTLSSIAQHGPLWTCAKTTLTVLNSSTAQLFDTSLEHRNNEAPEQHGAHLVEGRHVHVSGQTFNAGSSTEPLVSELH